MFQTYANKRHLFYQRSILTPFTPWGKTCTILFLQ